MPLASEQHGFQGAGGAADDQAIVKRAVNNRQTRLTAVKRRFRQTDLTIDPSRITLPLVGNAPAETNSITGQDHGRERRDGTKWADKPGYSHEKKKKGSVGGPKKFRRPPHHFRKHLMAARAPVFHHRARDALPCAHFQGAASPVRKIYNVAKWEWRKGKEGFPR
ncbi:hypothetical protein C8J57DRAFT_1230774 [Mycena rebaudengoi]|nr:hypothetical protein C8J57DRAFT_1230774 [Mycena rebaudengoi]